MTDFLKLFLQSYWNRTTDMHHLNCLSKSPSLFLFLKYILNVNSSWQNNIEKMIAETLRETFFPVLPILSMQIWTGQCQKKYKALVQILMFIVRFCQLGFITKNGHLRCWRAVAKSKIVPYSKWSCFQAAAAAVFSLEVTIYS